jgi:hypothetical protein
MDTAPDRMVPGERTVHVSGVHDSMKAPVITKAADGGDNVYVRVEVDLLSKRLDLQYRSCPCGSLQLLVS